MNSFKQSLEQKLKQKLSPLQIQFMNLVELPSEAFYEHIQKELSANVALENKEESETLLKPFHSSSSHYISSKLSNNISSKDTIPIPSSVTFEDMLYDQLHTFTIDTEDQKIIDFLIGSIDSSGYIRFSNEEISDDLAFKQNFYCDEKKIEHLITNVIQQLEPTGIGARSLQECLLLQIRKKYQQDKKNLVAQQILEQSFELFIQKKFEKLKYHHKLNDKALALALSKIEKLNPKPASNFNTSEASKQIIPDFTIEIEDDTFNLTLNTLNVPELKISKTYLDVIDEYEKSEKKDFHKNDSILYIKQKVDSAKWVIKTIQQRRETLLKTMQTIIQYQKTYLHTGDEKNLKPLTMRQVATKTNLDISTISRVVNSKYVDTPFGIRLLKFFFSGGIITDSGSKISNNHIKNKLKTYIKNENKSKPLTDEELVECFKNENIKIARRTITKYRKVLKIPIARLRKKLL